ncbi:MAG: ABC transporter ATP-binding protein [Clostridiales bacterium]|jgi:putative ABC transport system ATP-binding protein|nr:ABC transporter ATP-binding protein [Clostridiales bacterium]
MKENFIEFKNVEKIYKTGGGEIRAVDGLSFAMREGAFVVIVGPSGAGKTTLLNLLGGMDRPTGGEILVDGRPVHAMNETQLTLYRRNDVGFVFQFYNLMPNLTALENVELAAEICKNTLPPRETLHTVGLAGRENNFPAQLSGGEQQRVSIARAVAKNPKILLCDEPTGALDYGTGKKILGLLRDICKREGKTVLIVTHNGALPDMADTVVRLKNGKAVEIQDNPAPINIEEIEW